MEEEAEEERRGEEEEEGRVEMGRPLVVLVCGSLVYYHCAYRESSILSLVSDVLIVLLCSLAILGMLFRQMNISVPVDPLEWQISQDTANGVAACLANTIGAAESVLRVAATGHDKRLFFKAAHRPSVPSLVNVKSYEVDHSADCRAKMDKHRTNYWSFGVRCNSRLCRIVLVLFIHICAKLPIGQQICFSVFKEKGLNIWSPRCNVICQSCSNTFVSYV